MTSVIAHRGASAAHPENTVVAFEAAGPLGADWIELDVRRTADGQLVVRHDAHLPDGAALVDLVGTDLPASVPNLTAALDACRPLAVNIEIKNLAPDPDYDPDDQVAGAVVELLIARGGVDEVLISSFNLATIDRVRQLDAGLATAWLVYDFDDVDATVARARRHGHAALHPWDPLVDQRLVDQAHAAGLLVNTWTVDDPERMAQLVALGVDGIVTNVPDQARAIVDRTAQSG